MLIQTIMYTVAPDEADRAEAILHELRDLSRKEPGMVRFEVGRSKEKPNVFALWEEYVDEAAFEAHKATDHFKRLALGGIRQLAQQRVAEFVYPID